MAELKTQPTDGSVTSFLESVEEPQKRQDCYRLLQIMQEETGEEATMWGKSVVGFGSYHYKYATGREGDWYLTGFAPRKRNLTLYIMAGFEGSEALLGALGKHSIGKACLYIKQLADVDEDVLRRLVRESASYVAANDAS